MLYITMLHIYVTLLYVMSYLLVFYNYFFYLACCMCQVVQNCLMSIYMDMSISHYCWMHLSRATNVINSHTVTTNTNTNQWISLVYWKLIQLGITDKLLSFIIQENVFEQFHSSASHSVLKLSIIQSLIATTVSSK